MSELKVRGRIKGERIVVRHLQQLDRDLSGDEMADSLLAGAEVFASLMRHSAPRGHTGNLQRGIVAYNSRRVNGSPPRKRGWGRPVRRRSNEASADALAPHSSIVEFGTKERITTLKTKKALFFNGVFRNKTRSGKMTARPFWRPAFYRGKSKAFSAVSNGVQVMVEKANG